MENSGLARIFDTGGKYWTARSCVRGKLLEVNERLLKEPHLVREAPTGAGFLAIIMPRAEDVRKLSGNALSPDDYHVLRTTTTTTTTRDT